MCVREPCHNKAAFPLPTVLRTQSKLLTAFCGYFVRVTLQFNNTNGRTQSWECYETQERVFFKCVLLPGLKTWISLHLTAKFCGQCNRIHTCEWATKIGLDFQEAKCFTFLMESLHYIPDAPIPDTWYSWAQSGCISLSEWSVKEWVKLSESIWSIPAAWNCEGLLDILLWMDSVKECY